jgi:hypothetical protein
LDTNADVKEVDVIATNATKPLPSRREHAGIFVSIPAPAFPLAKEEVS